MREWLWISRTRRVGQPKKDMRSRWLSIIWVGLDSLSMSHAVSCGNMYITQPCDLFFTSGPFLLTNLLLDYLIQTANIMGDSRIINVTCALHDHENTFGMKGEIFLVVSWEDPSFRILHVASKYFFSFLRFGVPRSWEFPATERWNLQWTSSL